jgi:hypothetical protein
MTNNYLQKTELSIETIVYKRRLEAKMIREFKAEFKRKIGYEPQVLTMMEDYSSIPNIPLLTLRDTIDEILLDMYGDRVFLSEIARLRNRCRKTELVNMRFIYFKIARLLGNTLDSIADSMATLKSKRYDHTTILYGLEQFDNLVSRDESFKDLYLSVVDKIKEKYSKDGNDSSTDSE